jgi:hypothetical protein
MLDIVYTRALRVKNMVLHVSLLGSVGESSKECLLKI